MMLKLTDCWVVSGEQLVLLASELGDSLINELQVSSVMMSEDEA
jgi:hypothetical protein